jgi:arginyl-tRNA synthetase
MEQLVITWLQKTFDQEFCSKIEFSPVPRGQKGDLAMKFFQLTKSEGQSPVQIAKRIADALADCDVVERTELAGPYLNLYFAPQQFFEKVFQTPLKGTVSEGQNIIIEFSGPNTNKPLHLGHMRNHALGISVSNLLEAVGATVHRVNIINDRGIHICKSMIAYEKWGEKQEPNKKSDHFIGDWYVRFDQESKKNESLIDEAKEMLVKWEQEDKDVRTLWKKMSDWALTGHKETYARQGIHFEKEYFESKYYTAGRDIAEKGLQQGVFQKREDGAIVINLEDEGLDEKVILRADGTSIYLTQDLAVATARMKDFNPDQMMYVVADEQNYHFKVLFSCLNKLGLIEPKHLHHLGYGLVNLPDGRMKSREGTVVDADNLMDELHDLAAEEISKRHDDWKKDEIDDTAEKIQDAAWKFFLLQTSPKKSITFDAQKSIAFEGATGPYLQYAAVRIQSILRKAGEQPKTNAATYLGEEEKLLGAKILAFPDILNRAAENLNPTYVVTYLLELAQDWSSYYAANSVLQAETPELIHARVALAEKVLSVLKKGMAVLGFQAPERM